MEFGHHPEPVEAAFKAGASGARPVDDSLTPSELTLLDRILDDFVDCGETEVPHEVLMDFARRGYLLCERFTPTKKAHKALAAGSAIGGVAPSCGETASPRRGHEES